MFFVGVPASFGTFLFLVLLLRTTSGGVDDALSCYSCSDKAAQRWMCNETVFNSTHFIYRCVIPPEVKAESCQYRSHPRLDPGFGLNFCTLQNHFREVPNGTESFVAGRSIVYGSVAELSASDNDDCVIGYDSLEAWQATLLNSQSIECHCVRDGCNDRLSVYWRYKNDPTEATPTRRSENATVASSGSAARPTQGTWQAGDVAAALLGVVMIALMLALLALGILLLIRLRQRKKCRQQLISSKQECLGGASSNSSGDGEQADVESLTE